MSRSRAQKVQLNSALFLAWFISAFAEVMAAPPEYSTSSTHEAKKAKYKTALAEHYEKVALHFLIFAGVALGALAVVEFINWVNNKIEEGRTWRTVVRSIEEKQKAKKPAGQAKKEGTSKNIFLKKVRANLKTPSPETSPMPLQHSSSTQAITTYLQPDAPKEETDSQLWHRRKGKSAKSRHTENQQKQQARLEVLKEQKLLQAETDAEHFAEMKRELEEAKKFQALLRKFPAPNSLNIFDQIPNDCLTSMWPSDLKEFETSKTPSPTSRNTKS